MKQVSINIDESSMNIDESSMNIDEATMNIEEVWILMNSVWIFTNNEQLQYVCLHYNYHLNFHNLFFFNFPLKY